MDQSLCSGNRYTPNEKPNAFLRHYSRTVFFNDKMYDIQSLKGWLVFELRWGNVHCR
jgi:hypothetical protein